MTPQRTLPGAGLRTLKAGACAGLAFAVLLATIFWLLRRSVPPDSLGPEAWLGPSSGTITIALNLVPFAGIAFLWFLGALRDRIGHLEDQFFATVFFGSALLFLAMLFTAAATMGALILAVGTQGADTIQSSTSYFARAVVHIIMNVYALKMAAVFMISTSTAVLYTGIAPRWVATIGFALALFLLLGSQLTGWSFMVLPLWVFMISAILLYEPNGDLR
jgi:hypothetical protein